MSRAAVVGRVARLLVLACTLLGLAAMHTIGHTGVEHHHAADQEAANTASGAQHGLAAWFVVAAMHDVPAVLSSTVLFASPDHCPGDGCVHAAFTPGGAADGMGGWDLCVAVLSAFAVAALLAVLLLMAMAGRAPPRPGGAARQAVPGTPPRPGVGLQLAAVSVLRI